MANMLATGLSRSGVEELSRLKGEPEWMLQKRLHAWEVYESTPTPLGRRGDLGTLQTFSRFKFQELLPYVPIESGEVLPTVIEQALQDALVDVRAGLVVQRNASVIRKELDDRLSQKGVILTDLDTAVRKYPELVQQYFMTSCVPVESNKYTALHAAFWSGGTFLYIPKGVEIEEPVLSRLWIDAPGSATFTHTLIIAEEQSSVRYVEEQNSSFDDERPSLLDSVVEVYIKNAARVEFSIVNRNAYQEKDGSVVWVMADLGSKVMLSNVGSSLVGHGSVAELTGVFFTDQDQRYSIKTLSDHIGTATNAETLVKGALADLSRAEFEGMIRVRPKAQQTASFLSVHTLLLSDKCRAESIPSLEIGANEVSASHGATTGKIDEDQLFYLMVRGIPRDEAERIIVQGFFEPVLQRIPLENLRVRLRRSIVRRMRGSHEVEADTWVDATETQERWEIEGVDETAVSLDGKKSEEEIQLSEI